MMVGVYFCLVGAGLFLANLQHRPVLPLPFQKLIQLPS